MADVVQEMKSLMAVAILWLGSFAVILSASSDFIRDSEVFRHGTYDRIWKPQAVYVDTDGTLLLPVSDHLVVKERKEIERILSLYPGERRKMLEMRVYIHPNASWTKIHDFVAWISKQNIGNLSFRVAELKVLDPAKTKKQEAQQDAP